MADFLSAIHTLGSRGILRAVDQLYELKREGEEGDYGPQAWLECEASRYTFSTNVGTSQNPF